MTLLQTLAKSVVVFLFLLLSLWWSLTSAVVYTRTRRVPKALFRFEHEKDAQLEFLMSPGNVLESAIFSAVALPGYLEVTNGGEGILRSHVDGYRKYLWLSLTPWLITFAQGCINSVTTLLWNVSSVLVANNFKVFVVQWVAALAVQVMLWSEVFCIALQGYLRMKNAHSREIEDLTRIIHIALQKE